MSNNTNMPVVAIGQTEIQKITYQGQQVVTFAMIDKVHSRPDGTASRNFRENRDRFSANDDYVILDQPDEIRRLGFKRPQGGTAASIILVTKRGYLKIAKTLGDDKAWEVFDEMLERYFSAEAPKPVEFVIPQTFSDALRLAAVQADQIEKQKALIMDMTPKAEFHDAVSNATNSQQLRTAAKALGTGQNRLFKLLRDMKILMKNNEPYQPFIDAGYFKIVEKTYVEPTGEKRLYQQTLVTGKGLQYLQKKLAGAA